MRIAICVKQVPATADVQIDRVTKRLKRENNAVEMNACDCYAMELALRLREKYGASVTAFTMGPPQARAVLKSCRALGAESGYILNDMAFAGSDTYATAHILSCAIKADETENGPFDLILCGRQSSDGDTAQVGPQIAEQLNIPQITYVQKLDIEGDKVIVQRQLEDGYTVVEAKMPVLLTAIKELNTPRYMTPKGIFEAYNKTVQVWGFNDVPVDAEKIGLKGSPTNVNRTFSPEAKGKGIMLEGADKETVKTLIAKLDEKHLL